ncbi:MAG: AAA family ATPase [Chloroflexi bacterium]|nr:AAA family ATPase [Chloroflexota bacterium]
MRSGSVFVGRYRELARLREGLGQVAHGAAMISSVAGEAGIGKTALVSQAMDSAAGLGIRVARSSAVEGGGSPAYWLWKDVLRQFSIGDQIDFDGLEQIDGLQPDVVANLPANVATRAQSEFRFYEDVTDCLRVGAGEAPLLIVLEDLHWADDESLRLLSHFVHGLAGIEAAVGIGLIVTYRDRPGGGPDSFSNTILQVARAAGSENIQLGPFSKEESAEAVRLIVGNVGNIATDDVFERTGGNPLFVTEIARMTGAEGTMAGAEGTLRDLPATVQLVIDDRLGALSPTAIELLEIASLARGAFAPAVLLDVAKKWTLEDVHSALGEATDYRFLAETPGPAGAWDFRHAVVREAVASRIGNDRRTRLHLAYLDVLEIEYQNALPERSEELLFHALRAGPLVERGRVVRYLLFAARAGMRSLAFERAAGHFLGVIKLGEAEEIDGSLAEAMHGFALAASGSGRDQQIADYFQRSFRYYISAGLIDLALEVAQIRFIDNTGMSQAIDVYEAAIELVEPDSRIEANILGRLSRSVGTTRGDFTRAKGLLDRAIDIARALGDLTLEMQLCGDGIHIAQFNGEFAASRGYCDRVVELAEVTSDPLSESSAYVHLGIYRFASGDSERGFDYLRRSMQRANDSHVSERISSSHKVLASAFIRACDWESAAQHIESALGHYPTDARVLGLKVTLAAMTGDSGGFEAALGEFMQTAESNRDVGEGATTRYLQMAHRARQDDRLLSEIRRSITAIEYRSRTTEMIGGAVALGMACLALEGGRDDYSSIRERLMGLKLPDSEMSYLPGITSLAGLVEEAENEFERMISFAVDSGQVFNEAWLRYDYAAHLVRHARGETVIARAVAQGRRVAERAGIVMLAGRYDQLESTNVSRKSRTAGLTRRELEILQLIHSGMSNPDIAEQLFLSRHTVVRHISNIFAKLEVSNRTEAGKMAVELGLVQGV